MIEKTLYQHVLDLLDKRNVPVESLGGLVYAGQKEHNPDIELDECIDAVYHVLNKREIQNILLLGINLDMWADRGIEDQYLAEILNEDSGLFQCDETLSWIIGENTPTSISGG